MPASQVNPPARVEAMQRRFGHFGLVRLLGRSSATMAWQARDLRSQQDVLLMLPRRAFGGSAAELGRALEGARRVARVEHPRLQAPSEIGQFAGWLYVACVPRQETRTLGDWLAQRGQPHAAVEVAGWCCDALEGLASVHDAGLAHGDVGLHSLLVDRHGRVRPWGLAVAEAAMAPGAGWTPAQRDVAGMGLLMHGLLAGPLATEVEDLPARLERLRLSPLHWGADSAAALPPVLRAIVDRSVAVEAGRRYAGARSLLRALDGWRESVGAGRATLVTLLLSRLRSAGHLPALPGLASRVSRLSRMDDQPLQVLLGWILEDPPLGLELLRMVNAGRRGRSDAEAVASLRRAMQLVGLQGLRRAAGGLRAWPGGLSVAQAAALSDRLLRARHAAHLAMLMAPSGLALDTVGLVAQLQQFGTLLLYYHFPEEAAQWEALCRPVADGTGADQLTAGLDEAAAARAVLGVELPALTRAVLLHWGVGEELEGLAQPLSTDQPVRLPEQPAGWVRLVASCANETLRAWRDQPVRGGQPLETVAQRYGRSLGLQPVDLESMIRRSLQAAREAGQQIGLDVPAEAATTRPAPSGG